MQNRFTIKDFLTVLVMALILLSVWLSMVQRDREWNRLLSIESRIGRMETALSEVQTQLDRGVVRTGAAARGDSSGPASVALDETWAVPGVAIEWQPMPGPATDPRAEPGFAVGGEFCELFEAQPAKLVPYLSQDVYGTRVLDRIVESLANFNPNTLVLRGELADAWQIDPSGLWIRAHINPLARFSDGSPLTAHDVVWTFHEFILNPEIDAVRTRSTMEDSFDKAVAINDQTVHFTFKKAVFTNVLTALGNGILPKAYYSQFTPTQINQSTGLAMGSGLFRLEQLPMGTEDLATQWTPGNDVVLQRSERYWGVRPSLDRLRFRTVKDEMARLVAFRNGEGSMMLPSSPQFNKVLREEPEFADDNFALKWINMRCGYSFIAWQCGARGNRTLPFSDKRVRQAMSMLLDRERMIRDIWEGIGVVSKGPMNPESPGSDPALKPWPYDPERAAALLAEAGWADRNEDGVLENAVGDQFEFEYTYATGGEISERLARFTKDSYARAGIRMNTRPVDWSRYQEILKMRDFDAITMGWGANAPESDPRQIYHTESIKEGGDNFVQWSCPEVDALIDQGRTTMDEATRMLVWQRFEAKVAEECPYTFIRVAPWLRFIKRDFGNVQPYRKGLEPQEFFHIGGSGSTPVTGS
ncbi:MAG: hypothetical protein EXS00_07195 [Phycisphaerales bacterium]|nr:hypothetical protein [Phycisphaerales bacterium]